MKKKSVGRLAFRAEGEWWNAYYAQEHTMDNAIFLGSIRMSIVRKNGDIKDAFFNLMQQAVSDGFAEIGFGDVKWNDPHKAPEHERSGSA